MRSRVPFEQELAGGDVSVKVVGNQFEGVKMWIQLERASKRGWRGLGVDEVVEEHSVCIHE